jgi:hypothetical protein
MDDIDVMWIMPGRRTITFDVDNIWSMIRMMPPAGKYPAKPNSIF